jgi:hypothetical protein
MKPITTGTLFAAFQVAALVALPAGAAMAQLSSDHETVNSYTADDLRKAQAAASAAGFTPGPVGSAQAGNIFMKATKGGQTYFLTITPDEHVYSSNAA